MMGSHLFMLTDNEVLPVQPSTTRTPPVAQDQHNKKI